MRTLPTRAALAALAVTMSVLGWPHSHCAAIAGEQPAGTARLSEELSIYLGCGAVEGPGTVVQLDAAGRDRGTVQLSDTPYGLAVRKQDLAAALPSYKKPGRIVSIDA